VRAQAIVRIWVEHALRRVQFPALVARPGGYARIEVEVDDVLAGVPVPLLDVGSQALRRYEKVMTVQALRSRGGPKKA